MRLLTLSLCVLLFAAAAAPVRAQPRPVAAFVDDGRIDRVEAWMKASARHEPGTADAAAGDVGAWPTRDLQTLWIDVDVLVKLMRHPGMARFTMKMPDRASQEIRYTAAQLRRLRTLACVAVGIVADRHCVENKAAVDRDAELLSVSRPALASRVAGDGDNYLLRRGALLHADVAMLGVPSGVEPIPASRSPGPERFKMTLTDGRQTDFGQAAVHWDIAQMLLDQVTPAGESAPAPGRDEMVRLWYRATATWMQQVEDHDTDHLNRARQIFPADPEILFLSGSQRETYAGPSIQSAVRTAVLPAGVTFSLASSPWELREAEGFLRHALEIDPDHVEARLRLGRVQGLLGHHAAAARELRQALASADEDLLRYYGELFVGAEEEALGRYDAALEAYQQAAALYPTAQSPLLALSNLARRRGDRAGVLRALQQLFALPSSKEDREDPWWTYHVAQARNAMPLLEQLWRPFRTAREP